MRNSLVLVLCSIFIITQNSCDSFEPSGPVPAFVYIPGFELQTKDDNSQGNSSHDIRDAWVYVDNELLGVFEVPITVPVLRTGKHKITVFAGIKNNGLANSRITYPFYTSYIDTLDLVETEIDTITPIIKYYESIQFPLIEDFEDNSISFTKSGTDVTVDSMYITKDPLLVLNYDGTKNTASGGVDIPTGYQVFQNSTVSTYALPRGDAVYLELDYKSDVNLQVGIIPFRNGLLDVVPVLLLFSTEGEWKKAYISLAEDLNNQLYDGAEFKVFFDAVSNNESAVNHIYLDNIKLVHR